MTELIQAPRFSDRDWTIDLAAQIAIIQHSHEQIAAVTDVPPEVQPIHAAILEATAACNQSTVHLSRGIDRGSVAEIELATTFMQQCGTKSVIANDLLQEYLQQFNP